MTTLRKLLISTTAVTAAMCLANAVYAQETIKRIKAAGSIKVCMAESRPLAVKDPASGQWSGYNINLANDLAQSLGVKLEFLDQPYATIIPSLLSGKCDIMMAPWFATAERAQVVAFTAPYNSQGLKVLVNNDAKQSTWEDLNNADTTFAVQAGTQPEIFARKAFPKAKIKPVVSENAATAFFLELTSRRATAVIADEFSAKVFLAENPQAKIRYLQPERTESPSERAFAVRPDDWHFVSFLNVWLAGAKDKYAKE